MSCQSVGMHLLYPLYDVAKMLIVKWDFPDVHLLSAAQRKAFHR